MDIQEAANVFGKMAATTAKSVPGMIPALFRHALVSSQGALCAFSELPGCRAERRVQVFLPDIWLLSNVFFVSKGNKSTSDVALCTMNFALKHQ